MSYQVLARKWRPQNFSQVVGQPHVLTALSNGLAQNRVHHAYLFSGTRGVGKTTIARILAKSLNCEQGVTATPCGKCENCVAIDQGRFVDLLEIDAASRTKVDDTRELLDNVQYKPAVGRYKVYLIDEVHMLSKHSFNALLKTLEEPPEYVKFLLATTDPQKLPITVLSRCLQFHLKAILPEQIEGQLEHILQHEKATFEHQALNIIAKAADGSMRDALSLTDQALAFGAGNIEYQAVLKMLGTLDNSHLHYLLHFIASGNVVKVFQKIEEFVSLGADFAKLHQELAGLCHQIALQQLQRKTSSSEKSAIQLLSERLSPEEVQLYYQIALEGYKDYRFAPNGKVALEMTVMRLLAFKPANYIELDESKLGKSTEQHEDISEPTLQHEAVSQATTESVVSSNVDTSHVNVRQAEPAHVQAEALPISQPVKQESNEAVAVDTQRPEQIHQLATPDAPISAPSQEEAPAPLQSMSEQVNVSREVPLQVDPQQSVEQITSSRNMLRSHRLKRNEIKKLQATAGTDLSKDEPVVAARTENKNINSDSLIEDKHNIASNVITHQKVVEAAPSQKIPNEQVTPKPLKKPLNSQPEEQTDYSFEDSYMDQFSDPYKDAYAGDDYDPYIPPEEMQASDAQPQEALEQLPTETKFSQVIEPENAPKPVVEPIIEASLPEPIAMQAKAPVVLNDIPLGKHPFFSAQEVESAEIDKAKYVEDKLTDPWSLAIQQMQIQGFAKLLAKHSVMKKTHDQIVLTLKTSQQHLLNDGKLCEELQAQLKNHFGAQYNMYIEVGNVEGQLTPFESEEALYEQYLINAKHAIIEDENIKALVNNCGAKVYENSVIPL